MTDTAKLVAAFGSTGYSTLVSQYNTLDKLTTTLGGRLDTLAGHGQKLWKEIGAGSQQAQSGLRSLGTEFSNLSRDLTKLDRGSRVFSDLTTDVRGLGSQLDRTSTRAGSFLRDVGSQAQSAETAVDRLSSRLGKIVGGTIRLGVSGGSGLGSSGSGGTSNRITDGIIGGALGTIGGQLVRGVEGIVRAGVGQIGDTVATGTAYGAEFSRVKMQLGDAELQNGAPAQINRLAMRLGADATAGPYSSLDALKSIDSAMKTGLTLNDLDQGGMGKQVLQLNTAGGPEFGVEHSAALLATMNNVFGRDEPAMKSRYADYLAGTANASSLGLGDIKNGVGTLGAQAHASGLGSKDMLTMLGIGGNSGLTGAAAGTAGKWYLNQLIPRSTKQMDAMAELGLIQTHTVGKGKHAKEAMVDGSNVMYGPNGIKSISAQADILQAKLAKFSKYDQSRLINQIWGAGAKMAIALGDQGAKGVDAFSAAVEKQANVARAATESTNNLKGSWDTLTGNVENIKINLEQNVDSPLKGVVDNINEVLGLVSEGRFDEALTAFFGNFGPVGRSIDHLRELIGQEGTLQGLLDGVPGLLDAARGEIVKAAGSLLGPDVASALDTGLLTLGTVGGGIGEKIFFGLRDNLPRWSAFAGELGGTITDMILGKEGSGGQFTAFAGRFIGSVGSSLGAWATNHPEGVAPEMKAILGTSLEQTLNDGATINNGIEAFGGSFGKIAHDGMKTGIERLVLDVHHGILHMTEKGFTIDGPTIGPPDFSKTIQGIKDFANSDWVRLIGNPEKFGEDWAKKILADDKAKTNPGPIQGPTRPTEPIPFIGPTKPDAPTQGPVRPIDSSLAGATPPDASRRRNLDDSLPGRALGGPVQAGRSYIVGERRPEVLTMGGSGYITPYVPQGGSGGMHITIGDIHIHPSGQGETIRAEDLTPALVQALHSALGQYSSLRNAAPAY